MMAAVGLETSNSSTEMTMVAAAPSGLATEMTMVAAEPSGLGVLRHEHHMHKNRLQEYAQRSGLPLPAYSTINEGEAHSPKFRATILVDGMKYTSPYTFSQRKAAEQDVAKHVLEIISIKFKNEGSLNIRKDPTFCKLILNEYAVKIKKDRPTYITAQQDGILPTFVTTITFDAKSYVGFPARNKKEAEQNAACVVIDYVLANLNTVTEMTQIIKTKGKLYATVNNNAYAENFALKSDDAYAENFTLKSEIESVHATIKRNDQMLVGTNGNLPVGPISWVPYTSTCADIAHCNQMNYQIPSSGLPMPIVDSQVIVPRNKKNKSKKNKANQAKKRRVDEQSIRDQVLLIILFLLMLPWGIHRRRTSGLFYFYLRCA